jgi:hypothetical protein
VIGKRLYSGQNELRKLRRCFMAENNREQNNQMIKIMLNEVEKSIDVMPTHASSEDSTVDQGFSSDTSNAACGTNSDSNP